jgi:MFS family permease
MHGTSAQAPSRATVARLVFGTTMGNLLSVTPTVTAVFGVFLVSISQEFGWTRTAVAGAFTALSLANAAMFPIAGRLADRYGTRPVLVTGFTLLGLAILGLSTISPNPFRFYLMFALTGAIGALPSNMVLCKLLSEWFDEGRGFWMGLTSGIGNGVGSTVMPMLAAVLMGHYGFRGAFVGIGLLVLLVGVPLALLTLRAPPELVRAGIPPDEALTGMTVGEALRSPLYWLIFSAVPIAGGSLTAVFANTVPIMLDRGLSITQATTVIAVFAMICTVWEPLVGFLLDRTDRPRVVAPFYAIAAVGVVVLIEAHGFGALLLGGVLTGIGLGSEFSVMAYVLSRYFGVRAMGAITGVAFAGVLCSTALAPIGLNLAFDRTGSYAPALWVVCAMLAYNAIVFTILGRYPTAYSPSVK